MQARTRLLDVALLFVALLGPFLYLAGIAMRGLSLLYSDYARLSFTYGVLAFSAAVSAYLALSRRASGVRVVAGLILLANVGSTIYIGKLWSGDIQRLILDTLMPPIELDQVGIVIAPESHASTATAEAQRLESAIQQILQQYGLDGYVVLRRSFPITSEQQARRVGQRLRANVVVWKPEPDQPGANTAYRVTVLGANETPVELEPVTLLLFMASEGTLVLGDGAGFHPDVAQGIAPVAVGFSALAAGRPIIAAAQFQSALEVPDIPSNMQRALRVYRGVALMWADRPDLAILEFEQANRIAPDAQAWAGIGIIRIARRDWDTAAEAFNRSLALDPYHPLPYCGLGILAARERNVAQAVLSYQQAIGLRPYSAAPYALLGLTYELEANITHAREAYRNAALYAPPNAGLHIAIEARAERIVRNPPTAVPTATPLPTPTPIPVPTVAIHVVRSGDTLRAIANMYEVPMEAIIDVNGLANPDAIIIGQQLLIPAKR